MSLEFNSGSDMSRNFVHPEGEGPTHLGVEYAQLAKDNRERCYPPGFGVPLRIEAVRISEYIIKLSDVEFRSRPDAEWLSVADLPVALVYQLLNGVEIPFGDGNSLVLRFAGASPRLGTF